MTSTPRLLGNGWGNKGWEHRLAKCGLYLYATIEDGYTGRKSHVRQMERGAGQYMCDLETAFTLSILILGGGIDIVNRDSSLVSGTYCALSTPSR